MQKLIRGLHEFQSNVVAKEREFFQKLALGQKPEALFITCSDSRIQPSFITQTRPGDLFIVRNAGNIVPPYSHETGGGEAATIEYAVAALSVSDIVVCGHSHCGAMTALLEPANLEGLPLMAKWLGHAEATRRIISENYGQLEGAALLTATVEENVLVQLENLRTHPTVSARLVKGTLRLHAWVYKIETGEVFSYDPEKGQFMPLADTPATGLPSRHAVAI
jgi:carbonic anhydrase